MIILELIHLYEGGDTFFDIGFFKTRDAVDAAIRLLLKEPGFCDHPNGFCALPRVVNTQKNDLDEIYAVPLLFFPTAYHGGNYTEYHTYLGYFETRTEAEQAARRYQALNPDGISGMDMVLEVCQYRLDEISAWREGFTAD